MTRVYINGIRGRMGSTAEKAVAEDADLELVGGGDHEDPLAEGIAQSNPDVVLDLTVASTGVKNTTTIIEAGKIPVVGTSGFTESDVEKLRQLAKKHGVGGIIVPNFAIGAVLMMMFAKQAAKYLPSAEIIEMHHDGKQDAPSGTAQRTAEMIAEAIRADGGEPSPKVPLKTRSIGVDGVAVHSVRLPGLVAHQEVIFGGAGQMLSIRHDSLNRDSFMPGVCLACKKAPGLTNLEYGLETIL